MERTFNARSDGGGRAVHDVGGLFAGPIDRHEHALTFHEKRVDALLMLLARPNVVGLRVDALRRMIESYSQSEYDGSAYYEKWMRAIRNLLVELEVLTPAEIEAKMEEVVRRLEAEGRTVSREAIP